jgi:hypothetical protein
MANDYLDMEGRCITATTNALLIHFDGDAAPSWIPRSLVEEGASVMRGDDDGFRVSLWWAAKHGYC